MGDSPASARDARSGGAAGSETAAGGHLDPVSSLEHEQAAWAAERDRRKADEICLIERMNDRIQDLMHR